jgi:primosomal protein N' (replication factor Y)
MVAKGLDFPNVALVGVVLADVSFSMPDFRSCEKTYQLLLQVGGRAGRADGDASFIIQTYNPEHMAIEAIVKNRASDFYKVELNARKELDYPPFVHMIRVVFGGENLNELENFVYKFAKFFAEGETVIGPSPCPIFKVKLKYRYQFYIKTKNVIKVISKLREIMSKIRGNCTVSIDTDSYSFL